MTIQEQMAYGLMAGGGALLAWPLASNALKAGVAKVKSVAGAKKAAVVDSDRPAPEGVVEYLKTITAASPMANSDLRMQYAIAGMTEAQVLRAEVDRLGRAV